MKRLLSLYWFNRDSLYEFESFFKNFPDFFSYHQALQSLNLNFFSFWEKSCEKMLLVMIEKKNRGKKFQPIFFPIWLALSKRVKRLQNIFVGEENNLRFLLFAFFFG